MTHGERYTSTRGGLNQITRNHGLSMCISLSLCVCVCVVRIGNTDDCRSEKERMDGRGRDDVSARNGVARQGGETGSGCVNGGTRRSGRQSWREQYSHARGCTDGRGERRENRKWRTGTQRNHQQHTSVKKKAHTHTRTCTTIAERLKERMRESTWCTKYINIYIN